MLRTVGDWYTVFPEWGRGDGAIIRGSDGSTLVRNYVVDFTEHHSDSVDMAISFMGGADARVVRGRFTDAGKLVLCGSGDTSEFDAGMSVVFEECILLDYCRRVPEAQDGMHIVLRRCLVRHWRDSDLFTVRDFGVQGGRGAKTIAQDCIFCDFIPALVMACK